MCNKFYIYDNGSFALIRDELVEIDGAEFVCDSSFLGAKSVILLDFMHSARAGIPMYEGTCEALHSFYNRLVREYEKDNGAIEWQRDKRRDSEAIQD